ncbi:MAG: tetratricopeptide repeat protein [Rudanella sp.]|nr:tetratricopeptide repeat protein [Rudanella sp.]
MSQFSRTDSANALLRWAFCLGLAAGLSACSQYSQRPISKGYHNLTAHYNAYFIAQDQLRQAETTLYKDRKENYNQILPILLPVDSLTNGPVKPFLDEAIKKASLVAERHQNSKWLDDAYVVIGKARMLKQDLPNAIEVFKYVNTKGTNEDDKHAALVGLMRAYVESGDYNNALNVSEFLRVQPLNNDNTRDFYLTKAYLHQRKGEPALAAGILDATFPALKKGEPTARLHLIAGQLYDQLGQSAKAADHYAAVLRNRPLYDQEFYANIYLIQSSGGQRGSGQSFEQMLADRKNTDLKDKIYYTMGQIESRRNKYDRAIDFYRQSVAATTTNMEQVPYTYLEMGKLYFEKKQDLVNAQMYYDSALALLPQQSAEYTSISARKKSLDEFVKYRNTIRTEDSLQSLVKLSPEALNAALTKAMKEQDKRDAAQAELARQVIEKATGRPTIAGVSQPGATNSDLAPNDRWYLYNPVRLTQGLQDFMTVWGNRPLEDDWRRSNKDASRALANDNNPANGGTPANDINPNNPLPARPDAINAVAGTPVPGVAPKDPMTNRLDVMKAKLPLMPLALSQSNQRVENALYKLGKLYKFQFDKPTEAIVTFEKLLTRYPNTLQKPEVYYLLFVSNDQLGRTSNWKDRLLAEYPNTSYARLAGKTGDQAVGSGTESLALKKYADIYYLYQSGNLTEGLAQVENALGQFTGTQIEDKFALLRVMLIGKVQGADPYRQALAEFIRDYPASLLVPHVKELQAAAEQLTAKRK